MRENLLGLIENFKDISIAVVGDLMLDEFIVGTVSRISPEAPVPVVNIKSQTYIPGGAANVAANLGALKAKVYLLGVVGKDKEGDSLLELLVKRGIDVGGVLIDESRPTTLKTRVIAHSQQLVRIDREITEPISDFLASKICDYFDEKINNISALIISDYAKGVIISQLLNRLVGYCKREQIKLIVDPKPQNLSMYKSAYIITPNQKEAEIMSGVCIKDEATLVEAGKVIFSKVDSDNLLITRGEHGMTLFEKNGKITNIETVAREVYDVTGAGDTVVSVLGLSLAAGADIYSAVYLANFAASVVVEKVGTAVVTADELRMRIQSSA